MGKTVIQRKLEIMQDIADLVRVHQDLGLGGALAELIETPDYRNCEDFATKMNMELSVIEEKAPDEAKPVYQTRFKVALLKGVEAFGEPSAFFQWADKQQHALGAESWRDLIHTKAGLQKVLDELGRIAPDNQPHVHSVS